MIKILIIFILILLIILNSSYEHMTYKHLGATTKKYSLSNNNNYSTNYSLESSQQNRDFYKSICNDLPVLNNSELNNLPVLNNLPLYNNNSTYKGLIEITNLPLFKGPVVANYQVNNNNIKNNNLAIYQDILEPLLSTCDINFNNYNLINVQFRKSKFSFNNSPVGLELHLVHTNYDSNYNIIIPLDLTNNPKTDITENFINVLYKKMDKTITNLEKEFALITDETILNTTILKKNIINKLIEAEKKIFNLNLIYKRIYDINSVSVNKLIDDSSLILNYECCGTTIGPTKQFNLCLVNTIINSTSNFRMIQDLNGDKYLIGEPIPFNEDIGLLIRSNIIDDPNIIYTI